MEPRWPCLCGVHSLLEGRSQTSRGLVQYSVGKAVAAHWKQGGCTVMQSGGLMGSPIKAEIQPMPCSSMHVLPWKRGAFVELQEGPQGPAGTLTGRHSTKGWKGKSPEGNTWIETRRVTEDEPAEADGEVGKSLPGRCVRANTEVGLSASQVLLERFTVNPCGASCTWSSTAFWESEGCALGAEHRARRRGAL